MSFFSKLTAKFSSKPSGNTLGVSLQENQLSYCVMSPQGELLTIESKPLEQGDYAASFANLAKQNSGFAHLLLPIGHYHITQIDKPQVADSEILGALKWQVKDLVPIPPENLVLDYFSIPGQPAGNERINVVCTGKTELLQLLQSCDDTDLQLKSITTPEFAFAKLVTSSEQPQLVVCQQPNSEAFIIVVYQGRLEFYRHLRGFTQLADKTPDELSYGTIDTLSLEIQKSIDYYERQLKQPPIQAIKVIIPMENEGFLIDKLAENTHLPLSALALDEVIAQHRDKAGSYGAYLLAEAASGN